MGIEIIAGIISSLLGILFPLSREIVVKHLSHSTVSEENKFDVLLRKIFKIEKKETKSYRERLSETLDILKNAFSEVDKATVEFTELMKEKEKNIAIIEDRLAQLSTEEADLKSRVETLQKVPIEAVTYFESMLNKGDKRSAYRDYTLFISGIVVSVCVTLILKFYFGI